MLATGPSLSISSATYSDPEAFAWAVPKSLYADSLSQEATNLGMRPLNPESIRRLNLSDAPTRYLNKFSRPVGIDIDEHDRIFVADAYSRIVVYRKDREYQESPL